MPLKGLPDFLDLSISLVLGDRQEAIEALGFNFVSTAHQEVLVRSS